jgi:hypothetical protein
METIDKHANHLPGIAPSSKLIAAQATFARKMRKKRFALFETLITPLSRPLNILDVGGTQAFWELMELIHDDLNITLYNVSHFNVSYPTLISVAGDARDMQEYEDKEFQIVFSNSVIEHVGSFAQQRQMADEVQRVGNRYYIQTPNRYFPLEPHFLFPCFQFLPVRFRVFLVTHFNLGWGGNIPDRQEALLAVKEIRLLTEKELKILFPGAKIYKEKLLGLTKSFIVYKGWEPHQAIWEELEVE